LVVCQPISGTAFGRRHAGTEASATILGGGTDADPEGRAGSFITNTIWQRNAFVSVIAAVTTTMMLPRIAGLPYRPGANADSMHAFRVFVDSGQPAGGFRGRLPESADAWDIVHPYARYYLLVSSIDP
jgi:hypothetical protein